METPIERAVSRAGSQTSLAASLRIKHPNVKQQHVWKWLRAGRAPAEYVIAIEQATGVSRYDLRPDIYPVEAQDRAA